MENENQTVAGATHKNLENEARAYFFQQGKHIVKINQILDSNILVHHLTKWLSVLLETICYLVFFVMLVLVIVAPNNPLPEARIDQISFQPEVDDLTAAIVFAKIVVIVLSLPVLFLAIVLGKNRRKNQLIREAYSEAKEMKKEFDDALKTLKL